MCFRQQDASFIFSKSIVTMNRLICRPLPSLQNDAYSYPDVMVCMYEGYGCDQQEDEGDCAYSYNKTHGVTQAKFNPGSDNEQDVSLQPGLTEEVSGFGG